MNVFSGSRRIAAVVATLWGVGWLIAAITYDTKVYARYDFVVGGGFANFAGFTSGFTLFSCPKNTHRQELDIKTESGHPIQITLCISGPSINAPEGFVWDDDVVWDSDVVKILFSDGSSHIYEKVSGEITPEKVLERASKDYPQKKVAEISGSGVYWVDYKIRKEDQVRLNKLWWESWRSTYGQGLAIMVGGLVALLLFTLAMGWVVRGFLGVPRGMDSKP